MKQPFGVLPSGEAASLYTISSGNITAKITDFGATLVRLYVPGKDGQLIDVVLGYEDANAYATLGGHLGATVGRNANRIGDAKFTLNGKVYQLGINHFKNNLHSGPDCFDYRIWQVLEHKENAITFQMDSPDGDQGFPGNAQIKITYTVTESGIKLAYDGICDQDTVFNMTNHSYFNLAGHNKPELAMDQILQLSCSRFTVADEESIPTGEMRDVTGSPMDFLTAKAVGKDINNEYEPLFLQQGYDHNFEIDSQPCAKLHSDETGITMSVYTDCPGVQFYSGNYLDNPGKDGLHYIRRGGVCLETQHFPDSVNHPEWKQPFVAVNTPYHSETEYRFS